MEDLEKQLSKLAEAIDNSLAPLRGKKVTVDAADLALILGSASFILKMFDGETHPTICEMKKAFKRCVIAGGQPFSLH